MKAGSEEFFRAAEEVKVVFRAAKPVALVGVDDVVDWETQRSRNWYGVNRALAGTERAFLLADGLPGRPWYRHAIYAPGIDSGYEPVALPAIAEAVDAMDLEAAQRQIAALTAVLREARHSLENASSTTGACR